jgi:ABC-type polysaccharide/polyol phosphate transport system ATPase subunit
MAEDVVIRAEGLGKKYRIGHQAAPERYVALRDVIARNARNLARSAVDLVRGRALVGGDEVEEFWALRDVDFEIRRGEVMGIIGRNGAGKSTLLKVLSRITEPSEGRVEIHGRVASLLEVGTGFHPELTGRENIFLNGAILGMSGAEIRRKFDEIVDFAEVEKFLDTPVKRYSSGMYVRLAFAVAAHLEPDILIIDEVLSVGDAEFQKKCLGKMNDVAQQGRTVLFVSHQLDVVAKLCHRAILLRQGSIALTGGPEEVLQGYLLTRGEPATGGQLAGAQVAANLMETRFSANEASLVRMGLVFSEDVRLSEACVVLFSPNEQRVAMIDLRLDSQCLAYQANVERIIEIELHRFAIVPGEYRMILWMVHAGGSLEVTLGYVTVPPEPEHGRLSLYPENVNGVVRTYGAIRSSASDIGA